MIQPSRLPQEVSLRDYQQPPRVVEVAFGGTILSRTDMSVSDHSTLTRNRGGTYHITPISN